MKILTLAPDVPATSGMPGSPRLFNLCRELSRRHEILLLTYSSSPQRYRTFLCDPSTSGVFSKVELLPDVPAVNWWGQQWHRAHLAANFETRYRQPEHYRSIRKWIRELCLRERFDLVYVDLLSMIQFVDPVVSTPAIVDLHDSMTLMARRLMGAKRNWRHVLSTYLHLLRVQRLEASLDDRFELVITNSSVDEAVIKRLSGTINTLTINNGVDMEYFSPDSTVVEGDKIVFTGVMGYGPNEDAVLYFVKDIFPLIRVKRPKAEFWIVGSEPSDSVTALAHVPGIHVTGKVEDVRPYVRSAAVFVSPLRVGSGVKNKVLAAMAMQKAIVATSLSIDGLDLADNREVLLAETPQDFADKVVRMLEDRQTAQRLGANGLAKVRDRYSWTAMGNALESAIESMTASHNGHPYR